MRSPSALKAWFSSRNPGLEDWPDWARLGGWSGLAKDLQSPPAQTFQIRIGVTRRRLGRWAYLQDGGQSDIFQHGATGEKSAGTLTTRTAVAAARTALELNAEVSSGGSITVSARGRQWLLQGPLDGISIPAGGVGLVVEKGETISVKLTLRRAKLYALNWVPAKQQTVSDRNDWRSSKTLKTQQ